jgi:hypothetical protein
VWLEPWLNSGDKGGNMENTEYDWYTNCI